MVLVSIYMYTYIYNSIVETPLSVCTATCTFVYHNFKAVHSKVGARCLASCVWPPVN